MSCSKQIIDTEPELGDNSRIIIELQDDICQLNALLVVTQRQLDWYLKNEKEALQMEIYLKNQEPSATMQDSSNNKLPPEILTKIFHSFLKDKHFLLNLRLVCKNWISAIDDTAGIFRQLPFNIYDWRTFNDSTIIDKVKSIIISQPWKWFNSDLDKKWFEFCNRIGKSVENIIFNFQNTITSCSIISTANLTAAQDDDKEFINTCTQIMQSMLVSAGTLKELHILNPHILHSLVEMNKLPMFPSIQILVLVTSANTLEEIIYRFPNLIKIEVKSKSDGEEQNSIDNVLYEYIKSNKAKSIKEIIRHVLGHQCHLVWLKFVFTCANFGIKLKYIHKEKTKQYSCFFFRKRFLYDFTEEELQIGNINNLLTYEETSEAPINENTCKNFKFARLAINGNSNDNIILTKRIGCFKNIRYLNILFARPAKLQELMFLPKLDKLEYLMLSTVETNDQEVVCPFEAFNHVFPELLHLDIVGDVFGNDTSGIFSTAFLNFPNLTIIQLIELQILPTNLFVDLSKLELLEEIFVVDCDVTDEMFTMPCIEPQLLQQENADEELVHHHRPAIAAFKKLNVFSIHNCPGLTDICIVKGIALNPTIKELRIEPPDEVQEQFTAISIESLLNAKFERINHYHIYFKRTV